MIVHQHYTANRYRNYNYLLACAQTGQAVVIDPLDSQHCLDLAKQHGYEITHIINTHEHWDHIGGNQAVVEATGAKICAHPGARHLIDGIEIPLVADQVLRIGQEIELQILDTPGHTLAHVCILAQGSQIRLFCGDTLFNAGCGNCHNGGDVNLLYHTFVEQLAALPDDCLIYPGHDYLENNLRFSQQCEPGNPQIKTQLATINQHDPQHSLALNLSQEKQINPFFRCQQPQIIEQLHQKGARLSANPTPGEVFIALRAQRDHW